MPKYSPVGPHHPCHSSPTSSPPTIHLENRNQLECYLSTSLYFSLLKSSEKFTNPFTIMNLSAEQITINMFNKCLLIRTVLLWIIQWIKNSQDLKNIILFNEINLFLCLILYIFQSIHNYINNNCKYLVFFILCIM